MSSVHFGFLRCLPGHEVGSSGSFTGAIFDCVFSWAGKMKYWMSPT